MGRHEAIQDGLPPTSLETSRKTLRRVRSASPPFSCCQPPLSHIPRSIRGGARFPANTAVSSAPAAMNGAKGRRAVLPTWG